MSAYYNEHDKFAAEWLRKLIAQNLIAPGEVDERDIQNVQPEELRGFTQCHFFAGIGVWSYALRSAGWPDSKRVWTGSCPCQPFSVSGKRAGASDGRHLWPVWFPLIRESRPELVFGEQVASDDGLAWLDLVHADLEGQGYTVGAVDTCAAGVGAPHIRQRIYFCADAADARCDNAGQHGSRPSLLPARLEQCRDALSGSDSGRERRQQERGSASCHEEADGRARRNGSEPDGDHIAASDREAIERSDSDGRNASAEGLQRSREHGLLASDRGAGDSLHPESGNRGLSVRRRRQNEDPAEPGRASEALDRSNTEQSGLERLAGHEREWRGPGWLDPITARSVAAAGATRGFWRDCDWWYGRDGKFRPIEPGLFPLAHGAAKRVGRLRGYGNAINAEQAKAFIEAYRRVTEFPTKPCTDEVASGVE